MPDHIRNVLVQSLAAWHVAGEVRRHADGTLSLACGDRQLGVARASGALPFRWMVTGRACSRGVSSIAGLLRTVRAAVDPDYRPIRLRIAPLPIVPP